MFMLASTHVMRLPHGATAFGPSTTVFQTASVHVATPHLGVGLGVGRGVPRRRGVGCGVGLGAASPRAPFV